MPIVDLSKVKAQEPVPDDWYEMKVESAEDRKSKAGFDKISMGYKILSGPFTGRMVFDDMSFAPNAMPITKQKLVGLGFSDDFDGEITAEEMIGIVCRVHVGIEVSTQLDPETGAPYPDRNRIKKISASRSSVKDLLE